MVWIGLNLVCCVTLLYIIGLSLADEGDRAASWLKEYDRKVQVNYYNVTVAAWEYDTNITQHNGKAKVSEPIL